MAITIASPIMERVSKWADETCNFEGEVIIGRIDYNRDTRAGSGANLIVVDFFHTKNIGNSVDFNPTTEQIIHTTKMQVAFNFDFYGDEAYNNLKKLQVLINSETSTQWQKTLGVSVLKTTGEQNIRQATDAVTTNLVKTTLLVYANETIVEDVKRIDTAILDNFKLNK